ncbi:hypothetical protein QTP45_16580 [Klebsiella oxytoca]|nr:hypothetical protein [Klebsiella oxytoca]MDM4249929.1 hypothetical protein [Klebsiella oxytoca]MDM4279307.1 hypothetical protein [Klebsiella oxytoca]MDM4474275.1 hypothetical protein [Klebsiella oxytoca]MDM4482073.1 hypothetical protein [Klebsiella oxytoca]MDM4505258.1 hypothetical protein [Klebsiella oxytoca]
MTKLRKAFLAVAVTAVITTMTGFIPAASAAPQEGKKISHIGLMVQDMSNPFFSAMERNAKQAAAKIGATLNEWKGLPLIMRLINSCAIMGYTSSRRNSL